MLRALTNWGSRASDDQELAVPLVSAENSTAGIAARLLQGIGLGQVPFERQRPGLERLSGIPAGDTESEPAEQRAAPEDRSGTNTDGQQDDRSARVPSARWLSDILPFVGLLLVVFVQRHLIGIVASVWFTTVLHKVNLQIRQESCGQVQLTALATTWGLVSSQITMLSFVSGAASRA